MEGIVNILTLYLFFFEPKENLALGPKIDWSSQELIELEMNKWRQPGLDGSVTYCTYCAYWAK